MSNTRANLLFRQAALAPNNRVTRSKFPFILAIVVFLASLSLLITGIVKSNKKNKNSDIWMWVALMSLIGLVFGIFGIFQWR